MRWVVSLRVPASKVAISTYALAKKERRFDKCLPNKTSREISNAQRGAENSLYNFTASHKSRDTSSRRYAIRIKETKESRTGVIVHRHLRAEFVEAFPDAGP